MCHDGEAGKHGDKEGNTEGEHRLSKVTHGHVETVGATLQPENVQDNR